MLIKAKLIKKKYKTIFLIKLILNIELKKKKPKKRELLKNKNKNKILFKLIVLYNKFIF
jgi:hypothetical protein